MMKAQAIIQNSVQSSTPQQRCLPNVMLVESLDSWQEICHIVSGTNMECRHCSNHATPPQIPPFDSHRHEHQFPLAQWG